MFLSVPPPQVLGPFTFSIGDTTKLSNYARGGIVTQVKMPKTIVFKPYEEAIAAPEFVMSDFGKFDRPALWHIAFQVLTTKVGAQTSAFQVLTTKVGAQSSAFQVLTTKVCAQTSAFQVLTTKVGAQTSAFQVLTTKVGAQTSAFQVLTTKVGAQITAFQVLTTKVGAQTNFVLKSMVIKVWTILPLSSCLNYHAIICFVFVS